MNESFIIVVRAIIGFFTLLIFARALGKQHINQLTYFDYILGITIGSIAATLTTDLTSRAWNHWVGLLTWTACAFMLQLIALKWRFASKFIDGEPTIVIMDGMIMEHAMKRMRFRTDDLVEQLRQNGTFDIMQVKFAVVEANGKLSVLKKSEFQTVTLKDMNLPTTNSGISTEIIYNGIIIEQNLKELKHDRNWLLNELKKLNIQSPSEVFYMTLNPDGTLYTDKYQDHIKHLTDMGDYKGPF